jgi:hypothetical protein
MLMAFGDDRMRFAERIRQNPRKTKPTVGQKL